MTGRHGETTSSLRRSFRLAVLGVAFAAASAADAQAVKCSDFLHTPDGSWRSFASATVIGSAGPVRVEAGETFRADAGQGKNAHNKAPRDDAARQKADIARILDQLCGG